MREMSLIAAHISPMDQRDNPRMVSHGGVLSLSPFFLSKDNRCVRSLITMAIEKRDHKRRHFLPPPLTSACNVVEEKKENGSDLN